MDRNTICAKLERFICGSVYAQGSREWNAGQYDIRTNSKDSLFDILKLETPICFNSHSITKKVPLHGHPCFELMYMLRGQITHHFEGQTVAHSEGQTIPPSAGQTVTLSEGDLLIIPPGISHSIDACSKETVAVNIAVKNEFLSPDLLRTLSLCGPIYEIFTGVKKIPLHLSAHNSAEAAAAADMLLSEFLNPDILSAELIKNYFSTLLCILYRIYADDSGRIYRRVGDGHGDIAFVISYIENNFASASLNDAARIFGYDRSYLSKLIRRSTGKTFTELKHSFCLDHAKHLLRTTSLPVREISEQVGFSNVSYFYTIFCEDCGMTPTLWRESHSA